MRAVRPALVWGEVRLHGSSLVVVEEVRAVRLADELDRVRACTTLGGLRAVAKVGLPEAGCPVDLDSKAAAPDDEPFDWRTYDGFLAGTWPPLPTLEIERALGREGVYALEIAVGDGEIRKEESMGHGSGWRVDEHHHALLARVAAERDLGLRHDQPLIDRLARDEDWCWPEPRPDEAQAPAGGR